MNTKGTHIQMESNLDDVADDFYDALKVFRKARIKIPVKADPGTTRQVIDEISEELEGIIMVALEEFMVEDLIPVIARQYDSKAQNLQEHSLYFIKGGRDPSEVLESREAGFSDFIPTSSDFDRGFQELRGRLLKSQPIRRKNGVAIKSLGEGANSLEISDYTPTKGTGGATNYKNWFLAVELGTGVIENTGAWKRASGPTKDSSGDGSWWLPQTGQGLRMLGQKGFHIFWEENRRAPRQFWEKYVFEGFPNKLRDALKSRFPTVFR